MKITQQVFTKLDNALRYSEAEKEQMRKSIDDDTIDDKKRTDAEKKAFKSKIIHITPDELKMLYITYEIPIPKEVGEITDKNFSLAKEELWWALKKRVKPVEEENIHFKSIPITKKEAIEISETVRERGITVKEVQELMKKLDIPDYSKVTAKNKIQYVEMVLKKLNSAFQCESLKRAIVEIKEESFHRCGNEEVVISRKKSKIESKDLVPSTNIHALTKKYFEERSKKLV